MAVWGVASRIDGGEAVVVAVEVHGPRGRLAGEEVFRHRSNPHEDWAQKLTLLANDLDAQLKRSPPDAIVVRSMDWSRSRREATIRQRYQIEGAVLATARRHVVRVAALSGREIGALCGSDKQTVEAEAKRELGTLNPEATVAGLGALVLAGEG